MNSTESDLLLPELQLNLFNGCKTLIANVDTELETAWTNDRTELEVRTDKSANLGSVTVEPQNCKKKKKEHASDCKCQRGTDLRKTRCME